MFSQKGHYAGISVWLNLLQPVIESINRGRSNYGSGMLFFQYLTIRTNTANPYNMVIAEPLQYLVGLAGSVGANIRAISELLEIDDSVFIANWYLL